MNLSAALWLNVEDFLESLSQTPAVAQAELHHLHSACIWL